MQSFNEHQNRLWRSMLHSIAEFRHGKLRYDELVGRLEGALDAGEFKDKQLIKRWYDLWTPLEIARATRGNSVEQAEVAKYLEAMEKFMQSVLET